MVEAKEALFYEKLAGGKVKCTLCPHDCKISPGQAGICCVRQNIDGKLVSLIYAKASSLAVDPIEKKPLYHFYPGSQVLSIGSYGCNLSCGFCQNWQIAHKNFAKDQNLMYEEVSPEKAVHLAKETGCQGIAWTYNEPTIWFEYTYDSAVLAKKAGLYTVYVTNGYITEQALDMIGPYLDAYSVDLKSFNNEFYQKVCKIKDFTPILRVIERAKKKWNMQVEVTTLVIPTKNDSDDELKQIADWIVKHVGSATPWHVSRFMPYLEFKHLPPTPEATLIKAKEIGQKAGLKNVHIGNVPGLT